MSFDHRGKKTTKIQKTSSIFRFLPVLVPPGRMGLNLEGDNVETLPGVQTPKGIFPSIINNHYINRKQYHCLSSNYEPRKWL